MAITSLFNISGANAHDLKALGVDTLESLNPGLVHNAHQLIRNLRRFFAASTFRKHSKIALARVLLEGVDIATSSQIADIPLQEMQTNHAKPLTSGMVNVDFVPMVEL